ncbi:MAG: IS1380 family transposase [Gloeomargaritales cyanobacterium]
MNFNATTRVSVESGGIGVAAHVGLHALGSLADQLGLGASLSSRVERHGQRLALHDRGKVLVQLALVLAGGGESCADIEHLRVQEQLFGSVPSDSTVFRTLHEFDASRRVRLGEALAEVRARVWEKLDTTSDPVILDLDASLVDVHSELKEQAAPTYKHGFGFHPLFCFADLTGETLAAKLRAGNATANNAGDHVEVLDAALSQLPERITRGHHVDGEEIPARELVARADSAGCTKKFLSHCRARKITFFVSARSNAQLSSAIYATTEHPERWSSALEQSGEVSEHAQVTEVTSYLRLPKMPTGTRCIIRREPLHPGAQRSLFPSDDYRYWGFYTDAEGDPVELDRTMRAHAHVEQHIQRLKDSGLTRFPFTSFEANANWLMVVALSGDLVRWFQLLCLEGRWRDARPKALRWEIFHAPGRLIYSARRVVVRLLEGWPTTDQLLGAYQRLTLLT